MKYVYIYVNMHPLFYLCIYILLTLAIVLYFFNFNWYEMLVTLSIIGICMYFFLSSPVTDSGLDLALEKHNISSLFDNLSGYKSHHKVYDKSYVTTYGEIQYTAIEEIYKLAVQHGADNAFIDFGCGIGKGIIMALLVGFKKTYGVELVKERYDDAIVAVSRLPNKYKKNIFVFNGDMFDFDFKVTEGKPVCIFMSNLLFTVDVNKKIFHKIGTEAPKGTLVVCSGYNIQGDDLFRFKKLKTLSTPMSWNTDAFSYVFKVL